MTRQRRAPSSYYNAGRPHEVLGEAGLFLGLLPGLMFGAVFFRVPAIGPVLAGGPLVAWIIAVLEDALIVGGLSAVGAGL